MTTLVEHYGRNFIHIFASHVCGSSRRLSTCVHDLLYTCSDDCVEMDVQQFSTFDEVVRVYSQTSLFSTMWVCHPKHSPSTIFRPPPKYTSLRV